MSQSAKLHAARTALEELERSLREAGHTAYATIARLGLAASGESEAEKLRRERDAERKRTARGHPQDGARTAQDGGRTSGRYPADGARTARGHEGGVGGGVSRDLEEREEDLHTTVGDPGEGPQDGARTAQDGARTSAANATADGAFGMTVDAWADGIRSVTREFFPPPRGKAASCLVDVLGRMAGPTPPGDPCEHARQAARAYADANKGRRLDAFDFARWIGSGRPSGPRRVDEPPPDAPSRQRLTGP